MDQGKMKTLLLALSLVLAAVAAPAQTTTNRPAQWAQPMPVSGITNCYQVTTNLYRGSQPTAEGMKQLKAMGIKSVVNLRSFHSDKDELVGTDLKGFRFETKPWHAEEEDVIGFLKIVTNTNNLPAFIHCQRGADRTGTMCAMYRIVVGGWTKEQAIEEMKSGGFDFSPVWHNLVAYIEKADIAEIKRRVGLTSK
jgi:protein tyrosine/serine phosphatase